MVAGHTGNSAAPSGIFSMIFERKPGGGGSEGAGERERERERATSIHARIAG